MNTSQAEVERLLDGLGRGDRGSADDLFARVYHELKSLARRQRQRWRNHHTLNTTALVHEVYVKVVGHARVEAGDRAHFHALASRAMRQVLCNHARGARALKRGGALDRLPVEGEAASVAAPGVAAGSDPTRDTLCALDTALAELEKILPRASRVVECRFFGGMTIEETAVAVGTSPRSVKRDWAMAQAWLHRELERRGRDG